MRLIREEVFFRVSVDFSHTCLVRLRPRSVLTGNFAGEEDEMANETVCRVRYGEAFWRAHHEAWGRSELNQREYCEAHGIPLKAFGNWRRSSKPNRSRRRPGCCTGAET